MINSIRNPEGLLKLHKAYVRDNTMKQVLKHSLFLLALLTSVNVLAATRVTPINEVMQVNDNGCDVTVYPTPLSVLKNGEIEEICIIEGTSSGTFKNSADKTIRKNAHEACGCGTDKVYVMSRSEPDKKTTQVTIVAFKYVNEQATHLPAVDPYEAIKRKMSTYKQSRNSQQKPGNSQQKPRNSQQKPRNSQPANTRRVSIDDYELLPHTVTQSHQRGMVWLSLKTQSD